MLCDVTEHVEPELLHTYSKVYKWDVVLLIVRLAVLTAVTLTVPVVLFPVSVKCLQSLLMTSYSTCGDFILSSSSVCLFMGTNMDFPFLGISQFLTCLTDSQFCVYAVRAMTNE